MRTPIWSRRQLFRRIVETADAHALLLNSLAVGEADSAIDLDRIAEHVRDPRLAAQVYRHYAEERKHARLFRRHLEARGVPAQPLPPELDYETLVQRFGMGTPKARLDDPRPFDDLELAEFFCGSKAGEERACAEMASLIESLADDADTAALLSEIHADELRHVAYATAALQALAARGDRAQVVRRLRAARRAEARAHRIVSHAFMARLFALVGVPRWFRFFAGIAIDVAFVMRWLFPGGLDEPTLDDPMPVHVQGAA
jgi:hypothetical protein